MAITVDASSLSSAATNTTTISWSHTCSGSNRLLAVCVHARDWSFSSGTTDLPVSGITYNGVALTKVDGVTSSVSNNAYYRSEVWYLIAPATGANTITVTFTGTVDHIQGSAISFTDAKQSAQPDASNTATGSSTTPSVSVTTTTADTIVVDCVTHAWGATGTVGANQTDFENRATGTGDGSYAQAASRETAASAGSVTMSWTYGGSTVWSQVAAAFASAVATPAADPLTLFGGN